MYAPRIWIPKVKIAEAGLCLPTARCDGYFMLEACNRYGQVKRRLGPWKQLITDFGMPFLSFFNATDQAGQHGRCGVGTGNTPFTVGDTALSSQVAITGSRAGASNTVDTDGTDGYRESHVVTWDFGLGTVDDNISEVGSFQDGAGTEGIFLDLVRDGAGDPTTFPVGTDDQLRVTHVLNRYPFLGTVEDSFTIGGSAGSGVHDFDLNMASLDSTSATGSIFAGTFGIGNNSFQSWTLQGFRDCSALGDVEQAAPTGAVSLGSITGGGNGTVSDDGSTWTRSKSFVLGLADMNHANGINGFRFSSGNNRCYKMIVSPAIPKFAGGIERVLTLDVSAHWARS